VDPGEETLDALHREAREELGVGIEVGVHLVGPHADGTWPLGTDYRMHVWLAAVSDGVPQPLEDHDELRWLSAEQIDAVGWLPIDRALLPAARQHLQERNQRGRL